MLITRLVGPVRMKIKIVQQRLVETPNTGSDRNTLNKRNVIHIHALINNSYNNTNKCPKEKII